MKLSIAGRMDGVTISEERCQLEEISQVKDSVDGRSEHTMLASILARATICTGPAHVTAGGSVWCAKVPSRAA